MLDLIGDRLKSVDPNSVRGNVTRRKSRDQEHRHPTKSGYRRLAVEFRTVGQGEGTRSNYVHR